MALNRGPQEYRTLNEWGSIPYTSDPHLTYYQITRNVMFHTENPALVQVYTLGAIVIALLYSTVISRKYGEIFLVAVISAVGAEMHS